MENEILKRLLDPEGRIIRWSKRKAERDATLSYLCGKFEPGRSYTEKEVNETISRWHSFGDYALLRRELFDYHFLGRTPDGRTYWVEGKPAGETRT